MYQAITMKATPLHLLEVMMIIKSSSHQREEERRAIHSFRVFSCMMSLTLSTCKIVTYNNIHVVTLTL